MKLLPNTVRNENGFVLITALIMLVVLMVIGMAATNTSTVELQISGNNKASTQTFYQADGGARVGIALVEENIEEVGFASSDQGVVHVNELDLFLNENSALDWSSPDAYLPKGASGSDPRTDISIRSQLVIQAGSGLQMVAGYEGGGKGAASGSVRRYDIGARHYGPANSESTVVVEWNHVMK